MPEIPDSQKKISKGYSGNLAYFRRPHYLRSLKFWCFAATLTLCVLGVLGFDKWGSQKVFSTGRLSQNHAHLEDRCDTCHTGVDAKAGWDGVGDALVKFAKIGSLEAMDAACLKCHAGSGLHAPQVRNIGLNLAPPAGLVHASSCASCHREHAGPHRMALPSNQTCTDCHGSVSKMEASRPAQAQRPTVLQAAGNGGGALDLGGGVIVFLPPAAPAGAVPAFESFAQGHPGFGYERPGAVDPDDLKFNHARHFRSDIPKLNNAKLDCASCHQPEADGAFYQPVQYEKHCQECHSLQIQQSLPNLHIPHGDSQKVRLFLAGLESSIESSVRATGVKEPVAVSNRVKEEKEALRQRGLFSLEDLQKRVFLQGDPQDVSGERLMRSGKPKFLTECAKCHTVNAGGNGLEMAVQAPQIPKRWLSKGAFNHLPHKASACIDCHGAATKSKLTSDILLPTQQSCTECHQPFAAGKEGVKFSCQNCHHFHSSYTAPPLEASSRPAVPSTPLKLQP